MKGKLILIGAIAVIALGVFAYNRQGKVSNRPVAEDPKARQIAELQAVMEKNSDVDSQAHKEAYKQFCILTARPIAEREKAVANIKEYLARPDANVDFVCSRFEGNDYNKPAEEAYNAAQFGFRIDPKTNYIIEIADPVSNTSTWGRNADGTTWHTQQQPPYDYTDRYTQTQAQKIAYDFIVKHQDIFGVDLANWELDPSRIGMKDGGGTMVNYFVGWKNKNKSLTKEHEVCGDVDSKKAGAYKNAEGVWCIKQTSTNYQSVDVTITRGGQIIRYSNNINDLAKL